MLSGKQEAYMAVFQYKMLVSEAKWRWVESNGEAVLQAFVIKMAQNPQPDATMGTNKVDAAD
jgi:hypothetical protein